MKAKAEASADHSGTILFGFGLTVVFCRHDGVECAFVLSAIIVPTGGTACPPKRRYPTP
jgi:hypothetical protein